MQSRWGGSLLPFWRFFETGCNQGQCLTDSSQEPHRWAVLTNSSHCLNVWWQHCQWYLHYFCMDLHLHTEQKQELLRHKWHIYTLKQQGPVTDEHTAFMPALFTMVPAEQFFTACCCCLFSLTLTIYSHLIPPKSFPSCRIDYLVFLETCIRRRSQISRPVPIKVPFSRCVVQRREKKQI